MKKEEKAITIVMLKVLILIIAIGGIALLMQVNAQATTTILGVTGIIAIPILIAVIIYKIVEKEEEKELKRLEKK